MITKVTNTIENLKALFIEAFINHTDKATDIAPASILNANAYGVAKIGQKAIKDIAITEAKIFPETASGEYLDKCASLFGVSARQGSLGSSTYIRVQADPGTTFSPTGSTYFVSDDGIIFNIKFVDNSSIIIDNSGYGYIPVESATQGSNTNVAANAISNCVNPPTGFTQCTNEYAAIGGRDQESDETFRTRILNNFNILSKSTIGFIETALQNLNSNILKVMNVGVGVGGKLEILVCTQNGSLLSVEEISLLEEGLQPYLSLNDLTVEGGTMNFEIKNFQWYFVGGDTGIDFRVSINSSADVATVRQNIQVALTKYLDFTTWTPGGEIVWTDLLRIVKDTDGVNEVLNTSFFPNKNETVPVRQLPRIQKFVMRDLDGSVLYDSGSSLTPIFYTR